MPSPVDVVIPYSPAHTPEELLDRALTTVEWQTVEANPIVVTDDEQRGAAWARNEGLRRSRNRYVALLDADDFWVPNKLERQVDRLEESGAGLCLCRRYHFYSDVNTPKRDSTEEFIRDIVFGDLYGFTSTMIFDSEQVSATFNEALYRRDEHLFAVEAAAQADVCFVEELLSFLDKGAGGLSSAEDLDRKMEAHREFFELAVETCPFLKADRERYFWQMTHRTGISQYEEGNYVDAVTYLREALGYQWRGKTIGALALCLFNAIISVR